MARRQHHSQTPQNHLQKTRHRFWSLYNFLNPCLLRSYHLMTLVRRCFSPLSIPQFRSMAEDVWTAFSPPIPSSSQSNMRLLTEIVTSVSDHGCNGPEKTDNPGRALDACSCQRNVAQSTFDTRTLCDALVVDNSLLDIFETHLSHLCDVRVPASS